MVLKNENASATSKRKAQDYLDLFLDNTVGRCELHTYNLVLFIATEGSIDGVVDSDIVCGGDNV
jgi:hypothetical protein